MCTVTFIPAKHTVYLTSNRDEKSVRASAVHPRVYDFATGKIHFPKDADAGGTWIALHENGNAIVFLNGGVIKHIPQPPYRKSRGLILLDLIDKQNPFRSFNELPLDQIEPFTAIIWDNSKLYECRWDGKRKYISTPDPGEPHIWSSVTLYTPETIVKREGWFARWLEQCPAPSQDDILRFHQFTGDGDNHNDLRMNRDGETFTVSITSLKLEQREAVIRYLDLKSNEESVTSFQLEKHLFAVK